MGDASTIDKVKKMLKLEALDGHVANTNIVRDLTSDSPSSTLKGLEKSIASPDVEDIEKPVKLSMSKMTQKLNKVASAVGKVGGSLGYGMLAKSVITGIRHGDYETLGLIAGRYVI